MNPMTSAADMHIIEVDLDRDQAKIDFEKYKNHPVQPTGYNVFFHNPPLNPENRVLVAEGGKREKVLLESHIEPLEWNPETRGKVWDWAVSDVWAWMKSDDGSMFHITFTTVGHELAKLRKIRDYFNRNLLSGNNIYIDKPKYLPKGVDFKDQYKKEISYLNEKINELGIGFIKRDENDEYLFIACLPEENLSNEILEKWYPILVDFTKTKLECLNFSQGEIT